jgi:hypothetical protein
MEVGYHNTEQDLDHIAAILSPEPTCMDGSAIVGLQVKPRTWIAEREDSLAAYHELHRQVVGE